MICAYIRSKVKSRQKIMFDGLAMIAHALYNEGDDERHRRRPRYLALMLLITL
ncbi:hypothetical protein J6590_068661 [Homalodisca vitripennis]|nr:hypothetical protein J6590_068661 [Homalodisca vitripennis]